MSRYYTGILALTVFALIYMSVVVMVNHTLPVSKKRRFVLCFMVTMVGAICEWGAAYIGSAGGPRYLHLIVKTAELVIAPIIPVVAIQGISDDRRLFNFMLVVVFLNAVLECVSAFTGFIFYIDAANVYHHGQFYFIYMAMYLIGSIGLLITSVNVIREYQSKKSYMIIAAMAYLVFGLALQFIDSSIRVDYITITIVLMFFYMAHEDVIRSSDSVTKMLNRHSYDTKISRIAEGCLIINVDIDYFKQCNDTYGHLFGDEVLKAVAGVINACLPSGGLCYRTGGDEFCLIIRGRSIDPNVLLERMHASMEERRITMPSLPFISTGYATFDPMRESIIDAIERADAMMYKFKGLRKQLAAEGKNLKYHELQDLLRKTPLDSIRKK